MIIDAGTGLSNAALLISACGKAGSMLILMTHYHLDHVIGLPTFPFLFEKDRLVELAAPLRDGLTVEEALSKIIATPFWPVALNTLECNLRFITLPGEISAEPYTYHGLEIRWSPVHHTQCCSAFRVDDVKSGGACVVATDMEWQESTPEEKEALINLCTHPRPASVLLCDGQYTPWNYRNFRSWGHSTYLDAVEIASLAGAERLFITHHEPEARDDVLEAINQEVRKRMPGAQLAREGLEIDAP